MKNNRPKIALLAANLIDVFSSSVAKGAMEAAKKVDADLFVFPGKYLGYWDDKAAYDITYEYQYNVLFDLAAEGGFDYIIAADGTICHALNNQKHKEFLERLGPSPVICLASNVEGYDSLTYDNRSGIFEAVDELVFQGRKHIAILAGELDNFDCAERYAAFRERLEMHGIEFDEKYFQECELAYYSGDAAEKLLDRCHDIDAIVCANDTIAIEACKTLKARGIKIGKDVAVTGFDDIPQAAQYDPPIATVHADAEALGAKAVEIAAARVRGENAATEKVGTRFIKRDSCCRERSSKEGYLSLPDDERELLKKQFDNRIGADNVFVRDVMMLGSDLKNCYADILRPLSIVGGMTGFLYTLSEPCRHLPNEPFPKGLDWMFRAYGYCKNVFTVPENDQRIGLAEAFDNQYLCCNRQKCFIVSDLYSAEMQYGFALIEPKDDSFFSELELITYIFSSAIRTIDILRGQEKLLSELNIRNLALEKESNIDVLTGLYNRRGFLLAADKLISSAKDKSFAVCYADLDNLKVINDVHGHVEGDFALKLSAECLRSVFGEDAVIGRTGGDEFNAILPCKAADSAEKYAQAVDKYASEFNASGEKPFEFGVSAGIIVCGCENGYDLMAALDKADGLLYAVKQERKLNKKR